VFIHPGDTALDAASRLVPGFAVTTRLFTALNLLPSIATIACVNNSRPRHNSMNSLHARRMPLLLSFLKSEIVLKSGINRAVSHIISTLR
jgi:hypothetical protein